jgi:signal peptidase I
MAARSDAVLAPARAPRGSGLWSPIRRIGNAAGTAISVLVVMIGCAGIVVAIASHFAPEGQYTVFGHPMMVVLSGSMAPAIHTGDLVIDDPVGAAAASHLQAGQIISFQAGAKVITHRIEGVRVSGGQVAYVTRGDANNAIDQSPVLPSQIVGLYRTRIADGGYVLNALHQPLTLGLLLAAPVLWFISGLFFRAARALDAADRRASP